MEEFKRDTALNIYQRINCVMKEIDYIQKSDKKVNNQYRFVSHDQVASAMHGPLTKYGIVAVTSIIEMTQEGNRTNAKIEVKFVNIDKPEDFFSVIYFGYGIDAADKGPGKAISYAVKYALLKTFCLETGDDPDQDQTSRFDANKNPGNKSVAMVAPMAEDPDIIEKLSYFYSQYPEEDSKMIENYLYKCSTKGKISLSNLLLRYKNHELFMSEFTPFKEGILKKKNI